MLNFIKFSFIFFITSCFAQEISQLKISLIIPCDAKHAIYIEELLKNYEQQTVLPHEVILAISNSAKIDQRIISQIISTEWAFPIKYILSTDKLYAGENRNRGCEQASGDILLFQDADDIPFPTRIEVIKYFFQHHDIDHLMHLFIFSHEKTSRTNDKPSLKKIQYVFPKSYEDAWNTIKQFHNGNIAIKRSVFENFKWTSQPNGQDVEFNEKIYRSRKFNCAIILEPLVIYRIEHSSWKSILGNVNLISKYERNHDI